MKKGKRAQKDMRIPREIWVIFDPMNGPLLFSSEKAAYDVYRVWEKRQIEDGPCDAYWEITRPVRYVPLRDPRNGNGD